MTRRTLAARAMAVGLIAMVSTATDAQPPALSSPRTAAEYLGHQNVALTRSLTLRLEHVTLEAALQAIAAQAHVRISYSRTDVPLDKIVSLVLDSVTVEDALKLLLRGTGIGVQELPGGYLTLGRIGETWAQLVQGRVAGTISGTLTDSVTGAPVSYAIVAIDETGQRAQAGPAGRYTITGVAPGAYHVTARRVGYTAKTRTVTVEDGTVATLDFRLNQPPTKLDEVVTTAVGDQRRYQVGNTITTVNADSITPNAPITSVTDLLTSRAPGVEIMENSGLTGTGEAIRIRGLTSLVLQNDPILIVDGVRQDNSASGDISAYGWAGTHPTPSRLNDIDFGDIATIDVLKGPAASTEYGTDAANGVIVITTKHGTAGRTEWRASAEQAMSEIPAHYPNGYYSWGHTTDGTNTPVNCPVVAYPGAYALTNKNCAVDSVTQWNPLNHEATSVFGTGSRAKYDLSVGGGTEAVRYYIAGGLTNERGVTQLPSAFRQLAATSGIQLPGVERDANTLDQRSLRANTAIRLGNTGDLGFTGSYLSTYQRSPAVDDLLRGIVNGPAIGDAAHYYGYLYSNWTPIGTMGQVGSQSTDRFAGGVTANWRPTTWLTAHGVVGIDHGSQDHKAIAYPGLGNYDDLLPGLQQIGGTSDLYSVDLRATATGAITSGLRSNTSLGLQVVDNRSATQTATVMGITSQNLTLNGYANPTVTQLSNRVATLGGYAEEQLALFDHLFVTGALRVDAGSGFGSRYNAVAYPKVSLSYLALSSGATTVRVRGAFGESGVQPVNGASLELYQALATWGQGGPVSGAQLTWSGNSSLRPERTSELEGGVDLGFWDNRVSLEFTGYEKTTNDALVTVNLGASVGNIPFQENIGTVRNSGLEGTLTATLVQTRGLTWDLTLNGALNHNEIVRLNGATQVGHVGYAGLAEFRQAVGFPLYGLWARRVSYADLNHDGIIETNEVTIADSASYLGPSQPTQSASVSTHAGFLRGIVTVNALVDYRGGYRILNAALGSGDYVANQREGNDRTAPLANQARYAAAQLGNLAYGTLSSFIEDGTFVRFRELGITVALPQRLARAARVASLSLTGAVRNLALWTRYSGPDPETTNSGGGNTQTLTPTTGGGYSATNNDIRFDTGAVPLARYWVLRLTAGF